MAKILTSGDRIEFSFWEAGCLIWVGAKDLGGISYEDFCNLIWNNENQKLQEAIFEKKTFLAMDLYQDDGYNVRVVMGELNEQEREEWIARVRWHLDLSCGKMVVSGVLGEEDEFDDMPEAQAIADDGDDCLQCYIAVPPNQYQVEVYSYAPGDLSTGWGQIIDPQLFKPTEGIQPEPLKKYFERTRPNTSVPAWIGCEIEEDPERKQRYYDAVNDAPDFITFVVRLSPILEDLSPLELEDGGCVKWEFRKPDLCPLGLSR